MGLLGKAAAQWLSAGDDIVTGEAVPWTAPGTQIARGWASAKVDVSPEMRMCGEPPLRAPLATSIAAK
jgi:hypothetical protein